MSSTKNIVLVGFMATGKTSTGQFVAKSLGREFIDTDHEIERREKRDIPTIFAVDGEPAFRKIERDVIRDLSGRENLVIAPGGGAVLNPDNLADLGRSGIVICLRAKPETVLSRVGNDTNRPLLRAPNPLERIRELLAKRAPVYDSIALQLDTDGLTPEQVGVLVLDLIQRL